MDIEIHNLWKTYGEKILFSDWNARLPAHAVTGIMAASGRGKTTLFRILLGLETPDAGEITGLPAPSAITALFQEDRLCDDFSALTNVLLVQKKPKRAHALAILDALRLGDSIDKPAATLSGGMRRRVALARTLCADAMEAPDTLLLLDEPFTGLDDDTRACAIQTIQAHTAGKTLLVITHNAEDITALGGSILTL